MRYTEFIIIIFGPSVVGCVLHSHPSPSCGQKSLCIINLMYLIENCILDMKDGLDALLDSLKYNRTLRTLDLSGDQIGPNKVR